MVLLSVCVFEFLSNILCNEGPLVSYSIQHLCIEFQANYFTCGTIDCYHGSFKCEHWLSTRHTVWYVLTRSKLRWFRTVTTDSFHSNIRKSRATWWFVMTKMSLPRANCMPIWRILTLLSVTAVLNCKHGVLFMKPTHSDCVHHQWK